MVFRQRIGAATDGWIVAIRRQYLRSLWYGTDGRRRWRPVCRRYVHDRVCDRKRDADGRKCTVWRRHVGRGIRTDLRLYQPTDPTGETLHRLGVATAGGSFGQFAIVPFASLLQYRLDNWHTTMLVLGVMSMVMVPLAIGLREHRAPMSKSGVGGTQDAKDALQEAFQTYGFWLLTVGFFVCGFHVSFIGLHLPSYISDKAVGMS